MSYPGEIVVPRPKIVKKLSKKMVKKLSKSCQKVVKKLSKNCQKVAKSCQKVVKKLTKSCQKSCQKVVKKLKIQQTVVGGWGGEIVVPRPLASASLTGRRQKAQQLQLTTCHIRQSGNQIAAYSEGTLFLICHLF
jgi:HSP90 family molecular chaperone